MAKVLKLYDIRFKLPGRCNKVFHWERWAYDNRDARSKAHLALGREYPAGYKLVSVKLQRRR